MWNVEIFHLSCIIPCPCAIVLSFRTAIMSPPSPADVIFFSKIQLEFDFSFGSIFIPDFGFNLSAFTVDCDDDSSEDNDNISCYFSGDEIELQWTQIPQQRRPNFCQTIRSIKTSRSLTISHSPV
jgi:hypothetical protein